VNRSSMHRAPSRRAPLARVIATVAAAAVVGVTLSVASSGAALTATQSAAALPGKVTVWGDAAPVNGSVDSDKDSVELGTPFTPAKDGVVLGVRFYKTPENTGTHVGNLWDASGKRLATVTFAGETSRGWQTAYFDQPVKLKAGSGYVASYLAPQGRYQQTQQFWEGSKTDLLSVPKGKSGVYSDAHQDAGPDADRHAEADAHADAHRDGDSEADTHGDRDSDAHTHEHA
jgi:hypothetical protein